jgi:hypothetical protein
MTYRDQLACFWQLLQYFLARNWLDIMYVDSAEFEGWLTKLILAHLYNYFTNLQLPIYPVESPKPEVAEAPTQLEHTIRKARESVTDTYLIGRAHTQMVVDRWVGVEHAVEGED